MRHQPSAAREACRLAKLRHIDGESIYRHRLWLEASRKIGYANLA
jgi:hypothetical protein